MTPGTRGGSTHHVAFFIKSMAGGGAERAVALLAAELVEAGHRVDLVLPLARGPMLQELPKTVRVFDLGGGRALRGLLPLLRIPGAFRALLPAVLRDGKPRVLGSLPALTRYLRREAPTAVFSSLHFDHLVALWAGRLAGADALQVLVVQNTMSKEVENARNLDLRALPPLMRRWYAEADAIVCVSDGVAEDLARLAALPRDSLTTIYNPVDVERASRLAKEPVEHPWFARGQPPVLVTSGRLAPQKDHATLLRAFARLRRERPVRLWVMGEGRRRDTLEALARELGVDADVAWPGFVDNPFRYIARAGAFVLSSRWEGLPLVLLEALACGTPVVSTDCPSGPAEVLAGGRFGRLVPVGDEEALAGALLATLDEPPDPERLRARAGDFSARRVADRFVEQIDALLRERAGGSSGRLSPLAPGTRRGGGSGA